MDASQLDVLHNRGDKGVGAVGDSVGLSFYGVFEEFVNQDWALRCNFHGGSNIVFEHLFIVDYFHTASAEDIGRSYH
ncbi:hypothetical protein ES703_101631 [subsurface metagenome]